MTSTVSYLAIARPYCGTTMQFLRKIVASLLLLPLILLNRCVVDPLSFGDDDFIQRYLQFNDGLFAGRRYPSARPLFSPFRPLSRLPYNLLQALEPSYTNRRPGGDYYSEPAYKDPVRYHDDDEFLVGPNHIPFRPERRPHPPTRHNPIRFPDDNNNHFSEERPVFPAVHRPHRPQLDPGYTFLIKGNVYLLVNRHMEGKRARSVCGFTLPIFFSCRLPCH